MRICADFLDRAMPTADIAECLSEAGVQSIALPWTPETDMPTTSRLLRESGLDVAYVELPPFDGIAQDQIEHQAQMATLSIDSLASAGIQHLGITSGHRGSIGFDAMRILLGRVLAHANDSGVLVSVRNILDSAVEQMAPIRSLLHEFGQSLGLCLDSLEFHRAIVNPADAVISFPNRIRLARIRDERDERPCDIGSGNAHAEPTLQELKSEQFAGPLIVAADQTRSSLLTTYADPASPWV